VFLLLALAWFSRCRQRLEIVWQLFFLLASWLSPSARLTVGVDVHLPPFLSQGKAIILSLAGGWCPDFSLLLMVVCFGLVFSCRRSWIRFATHPPRGVTGWGTLFPLFVCLFGVGLTGVPRWHGTRVALRSVAVGSSAMARTRLWWEVFLLFATLCFRCSQALMVSSVLVRRSLSVSPI
jgi:hypothetical protein